MDSSKPRAYRHLKSQRFQILLWRLHDDEFNELRERSFPIHVDGFISLRLALAERNDPDALTLPKALIALEEIFGKSSSHIAPHKQTFSFPLALKIVRTEHEFHHLLKIEDYRGGLEFRIYRVVDTEKYLNIDLNFTQDPIEEELSKGDIEYLISYLWGYLQGAASVICKMTTDLQPFVRSVDSSHVIYGFADGEFFEMEIDDFDEYHAKVAELEEKYGKPFVPKVQKLDKTQAMLRTITSPG